MNAILEAHGLGKRYGHRHALAECTLTVPPGHVVGLVGPNGAGKTTLLKVACGMLAPSAERRAHRGARRTPGRRPRAAGLVACEPVLAEE
jgi:ABC-2 type transport system ATP-binding protein